MIAQRNNSEEKQVKSTMPLGNSKLARKKKPRVKKRRRMIIRNLSFKVEEADLKEIFSKFGTILDVKIPLSPDGKKRGFAFVEFEEAMPLINAMKSMNFKDIKGRKVAIDFAVSKETYEAKLQKLKQEGKEVPVTKKDIKPKSEIKIEDSSDQESDSKEIAIKVGSDSEAESESEDEEEEKLKEFLKEFDSGAEKLTKSTTQNESEGYSSDESSSDESGDENETKDIIYGKKIKKESEKDTKEIDKKPKIRDSQDVTEGRTVFLRNVAFTTDEETLQEALEEYGECEYCILCVDKLTDHPKGSAFIKFKRKDSADKLIQASSNEPGVVVDGRKLVCLTAISSQSISSLSVDTKQPKDKRNLNLLRVSMTKENEDVPMADTKKRAQLEIAKRQKLKNVNFFVSDKRLMIHNIPRNYSDNGLRNLFKKAAGPGAVITEVRIMKEFKKTDSEGKPLSKGFGFVSFKKHEHALKALNELNNNPNVFTSQRRPIVEFSVENIVALHSKERKKEKVQMRNKRRTEEKKERQLNQTPTDSTESSTLPTKGKKRKNKKNKSNVNKKMKENPVEKNSLCDKSKVVVTKGKKKKTNTRISKKEKKSLNEKSNETSMVNLINQYKDKLKNKLLD